MFGSEVIGLRAGESTTQQSTAPSASGYWEDGWWVDTTPDPWAPGGSRDLSLPRGFDDLEPGPALANLVWAADRSRLAGHDLVRLLRAEARLVAHFQAAMYTTTAEVATLVDDPDATAAEIAAALHLTRAASEAEYELARRLDLLPRVREALARGDIDLRRARVIVDTTRGLSTETADGMVDKVISDAPSLTTGQLRARLHRLRMQLDTEKTRAEFRAALEDRRIVVQANPDGTANLSAYNLSPERAMAIRRRLNQLARQAKTPGDTRTADQVRADVFCDFLTRNDQTGPSGSGSVDIVVDLTTLAGLDDKPGHIPGYGPVIAEIARKIVDKQTDCRWTYIGTDQGQPVATGTIRRRPTTAMKRHLRTLYPTCVFPGCRMPARESDIDHTKPWARHRRTRLRELAPLCRHHHQLRTKGWTYERLPDGTHQFTSPLGHTYITSGADPP